MPFSDETLMISCQRTDLLLVLWSAKDKLLQTVAKSKCTQKGPGYINVNRTLYSTVQKANNIIRNRCAEISLF